MVETPTIIVQKQIIGERIPSQAIFFLKKWCSNAEEQKIVSVVRSHAVCNVQPSCSIHMCFIHYAKNSLIQPHPGSSASLSCS